MVESPEIRSDKESIKNQVLEEKDPFSVVKKKLSQKEKRHLEFEQNYKKLN